jgi:hypothetical protein
MKLVIDITEHNKSVIDRFVDGEGFEILPAPIVDDVVRAIRNGKPTVHGKWISRQKLFNHSMAECDQCHKATEGIKLDYEYDVYKFPNYCPNCGASMRGGKDDK